MQKLKKQSMDKEEEEEEEERETAWQDVDGEKMESSGRNGDEQMEMNQKGRGGGKVKRKEVHCSEIVRDTTVEKEKRWTEKVIMREVEMKTGIETNTGTSMGTETGTGMEDGKETGKSMEDWIETGTETGTETGIMRERSRVHHHRHHRLTKTGVSVLCLWDH